MRTVIEGGGIVTDADGNVTTHWHAPDDPERDDCYWCSINIPITDDAIIEGYLARSRDARVSV